MVKYFFGSFQTRQYWVTKDANPQTLFTGNKKMFQSSFGFRRLYIPDESKRNLQKGLTCTKSVYSTSRMVLFRSKRNFKFPFQKIEVFSPQHSFSLAVKNGLFELRGMQNNRCYWKKKETVQKFGLETKNWGKKTNISFGF